MRSVVADLVRSRKTLRHGGQLAHETLPTDAQGGLQTGEAQDQEVLRVNEAFADPPKREPRLTTVVEWCCFDGLIDTEIAAMLGTTLHTVQRDWAKARVHSSSALKVPRSPQQPRLSRLSRRADSALQVPMTPPSRLRTTTVAERGRPLGL